MKEKNSGKKRVERDAKQVEHTEWKKGKIHVAKYRLIETG